MNIQQKNELLKKLKQRLSQDKGLKSDLLEAVQNKDKVTTRNILSNLGFKDSDSRKIALDWLERRQQAGEL